MDSSIAYSYLKTLVVKMASNTVREQLFSVLVPGYSMEPQTVLNHIWQCYINENGSAIHLSAQVYYTIFLNAIQSFYNLEEYPINIAGIFMAHIDPIYAKGFCANYSAHGQARERLAITQHCILIDMLQALLKAEAAVTNILEIVCVNQRSGEQFYQAPPGTAPAFPSLA